MYLCPCCFHNVRSSLAGQYVGGQLSCKTVGLARQGDTLDFHLSRTVHQSSHNVDMLGA